MVQGPGIGVHVPAETCTRQVGSSLASVRALTDVELVVVWVDQKKPKKLERWMVYWVAPGTAFQANVTVPAPEVLVSLWLVITGAVQVVPPPLVGVLVAVAVWVGVGPTGVFVTVGVSVGVEVGP